MEYDPLNPGKCIKFDGTIKITDYCKALEEINKLVCVQTTEDGWIIDPVTGYIYDPVTGLPHDPVTGLPIDLTGGGNNNQPFLDCYNKFLSFIDYYQDKENKPEEYDILVMYLSCLNKFL